MLSILICSVNPLFLEKVKINVRETIGAVHEILVWDNRKEQKPLTEVYNLLAARAQYAYWCFIHEDIQFDTLNWSAILLEAFDAHPDAGLIGIAGAKYKSRTPSGWATGIPELDFCSIWHKDKNGHTQRLYSNVSNSVFEYVVNVDGVFMAIRKEVWNHAKFNDQLLRGFHLYDLDFSSRVIQDWKAAVIFDIKIVHFTEGGSFGDDWLTWTLRWHRQNASVLPQASFAGSPPHGLEKKITCNWLYRLHGEKISWKNKWRWILAGNALRDPAAWHYIAYFLVGRFFRRLK